MSLRLQFSDYRLTTAEILYHMPDHPGLLQTYIWQQLDVSPRFPELRRFLKFWSREIEGKLHSIRVANCPTIQAPRWANTSHLMTLQ